MKRTDYETLAMEEIIVDVEGGFLSASVVSTNKNQVETIGHELNKIDLSEERFDWNSTEDGTNGWQ